MFNHDRVSAKKDDSQRGEPRSLNPSISVGGSAGAHPAAPSRAESEKSSLVSADSGGSQLVVGAGIKMTGVEVTDCDTLIVDGHLEASLDSRLVHVGETGVLSGNASMDVAEIWGQLEGEFTVRQRLIIHPTGRVKGCIRYGKIRVEDGGLIAGDISTSLEATQSAATRTEPTSIKQVSHQR